MFCGVRVASIVTAETIIKILTGSYITAACLVTSQDIYIKHIVCLIRAILHGVRLAESSLNRGALRQNGTRGRDQLDRLATCRRGDRSTKLSYTPNFC
jgi:hypothetical protein